MVDLFKSFTAQGSAFFVGVQSQPVSLPVFPLIAGRKSIDGSNIGNRHEIEEMLKFAAENNVKPQIEVFPMQEINAALEKLRKNQVRYRAVLKTN